MRVFALVVAVAALLAPQVSAGEAFFAGTEDDGSAVGLVFSVTADETGGDTFSTGQAFMVAVEGTPFFAFLYETHNDDGDLAAEGQVFTGGERLGIECHIADGTAEISFIRGDEHESSSEAMDGDFLLAFETLVIAHMQVTGEIGGRVEFRYIELDFEADPQPHSLVLAGEESFDLTGAIGPDGEPLGEVTATRVDHLGGAGTPIERYYFVDGELCAIHNEHQQVTLYQVDGATFESLVCTQEAFEAAIGE